MFKSILIPISAATATAFYTYFSFSKKEVVVVRQNQKCHQASELNNQKESFASTERVVSHNTFFLNINNSNTDSPNPCPRDKFQEFVEFQRTNQNSEEDEIIIREPEILYQLEYKDKELAIDYKSLSEGEKEDEEKRVEKLKTSEDHFRLGFPRFKIYTGTPRGSHYYGIYLKEYRDIEQFLGDRACEAPTLYFANGVVSYLGLFFTVLEGRGYGGKVSIINEKIYTPVEGTFSLKQLDSNPRPKIIPPGFWEMGVHKDLERDYKGFSYESLSIRQFVKGGFNSRYGKSLPPNPWLYNGCNEAISTISNFCSLDPSYDMQMKDFYYFPNEDFVIGNIFCKRSNQNKWTRIASFELLRVY